MGANQPGQGSAPVTAPGSPVAAPVGPVRAIQPIGNRPTDPAAGRGTVPSPAVQHGQAVVPGQPVAAVEGGAAPVRQGFTDAGMAEGVSS
jgi:hypothetical protein